MFLDSNNCYYIDGVGLFVFWPEIGQVFFYEEKKQEKTLLFDNIQTDRKDGITKLIIPGCKTTQLHKSSVDILFYSECSNELFHSFLTQERNVAKIAELQSRDQGQIDYLIVIKQSKALFHKSKQEPRVLRIDWTQKQIKYYGDEAFVKINNFRVPCEFPRGKTYKLSDLKVLFMSEYKISGNETKGLFSYYQKQLLSNGYGLFFLPPANQTRIYTELQSKLTDSNLLPPGINAEQLFKILNTSLLKNDWNQDIEDSNELLDEYINKLSIPAEEVKLNNLVQIQLEMLDKDGFNILLSKQLESRIESQEGYFIDKNFKCKIPVKKKKKDTSIIDLSFNNGIFVPKSTGTNSNYTNNSQLKSANCGADNCYFIVQDNMLQEYGLRISSKLFLKSDVQLYNLIIENLINKICHHYTDVLKSADVLPEISDVVSFGFIKVNFTKKGSEQILEGYIPYTLTEYKPTYITLHAYINQLCEKEPLTECDVEVFILNIMNQVYNFFALMKPYCNFSHNDFKTNNILINTENQRIYIIDFGYAQINIFGDEGCYNLTNRINFNQDPLSEYKWYIKYVNNLLNSDSDIETLLYWFINNFETEELTTTSRKLYYETVMGILNIMQPLPNKKPDASRDVKTILGTLVSNSVDFNGSLLKYRLYQIYLVLHNTSVLSNKVLTTKRLVNCGFNPQLVKYEPENNYRQYIIKYDETEYSKNNNAVSKLLKASQAGAQLLEASQAGGNRKNRKHRSHKNTNIPGLCNKTTKINPRTNSKTYHKKYSMKYIKKTNKHTNKLL